MAFGGDEPKSCEILMQGGLNPKLRRSITTNSCCRRLGTAIRRCSYTVCRPRKSSISRTCRGLPLDETIRRLRDAGLDSIPGAGAEILNDEVRDIIGFRKDRTEEWLGSASRGARAGNAPLRRR